MILDITMMEQILHNLSEIQYIDEPKSLETNYDTAMEDMMDTPILCIKAFAYMITERMIKYSSDYCELCENVFQIDSNKNLQMSMIHRTDCLVSNSFKFITHHIPICVHTETLPVQTQFRENILSIISNKFNVNSDGSLFILIYYLYLNLTGNGKWKSKDFNMFLLKLIPIIISYFEEKGVEYIC